MKYRADRITQWIEEMKLEGNPIKLISEYDIDTMETTCYFMSNIEISMEFGTNQRDLYLKLAEEILKGK